MAEGRIGGKWEEDEKEGQNGEQLEWGKIESVWRGESTERRKERGGGEY